MCFVLSNFHHKAEEGAIKMRVNLIPSVKTFEERSGFLRKKAITYQNQNLDTRLQSALAKLPYDEDGVCVEICITGQSGEDYELWIEENDIRIQAGGTAGAFYAVQTLRQIFEQDVVACAYIKDYPDFPYRGFYHDVTRGRVPTVDAIKKLIDRMSYYKLNSLQLYVEHVYEFEECKDLNAKTGYLTKEEILEIGKYCKQHFIEFIPSLSTFGHMYEILEQEQYQHLRVLKDFKKDRNFWKSRMSHHTIDPLQPESIEIVKHLIDQYEPLFDSKYFNICCDETFDLKRYAEEGYDVGRLYVDFVKQIINYVEQKGKKVMMWGDILLEHPEVINELPEDVCFLNWDYGKNPSENKVEVFAKLDRKQIVCPGTSIWNRFCETVETEESNISLMAEYGYRHGAAGVLNTNWGDWGHTCSMELSTYGMVLGAAKSWNVNMQIDDTFYQDVDTLIYGHQGAIECLKKLSQMQSLCSAYFMFGAYFDYRYEHKPDFSHIEPETVKRIQEKYSELKEILIADVWKKDVYRQEMLLAAEAVCMMAEFSAKIAGYDVQRLTDTKKWLKKYRESWLSQSKVSELGKIEEVFLYCDDI